jgi:hypothetical protein
MVEKASNPYAALDPMDGFAGVDGLFGRRFSSDQGLIG